MLSESTITKPKDVETRKASSSKVKLFQGYQLLFIPESRYNMLISNLTGTYLLIYVLLDCANQNMCSYQSVVLSMTSRKCLGIPRTIHHELGTSYT